MSTIKNCIDGDLKDAMRARNKQVVDALRYIMAAIKQVEIDERIILDDQRVLMILDKLAKKHRESITQFSAAGRDDLVNREELELNILKKYLPQQLSETEIIQLVEQTIVELNVSKVADISRVMSSLKPKLQSRCDMSMVSSLVKSKLH